MATVLCMEKQDFKHFNAPSELQAVYQPNVNSPSTSLTPQVQPGVNDPQILLAQLLMAYVLSQAQAPGMIPATGTLASVPVPAAAASQSILETEWWCRKSHQWDARSLHSRVTYTREENKSTLQKAPVWSRPNTLRKLSQKYSYNSRVLERGQLRVPWCEGVLGFL